METLANRITRDGPVNELDAVGWAIRLAKRLESLHALGVAHGSVSPACILIHGVERTSKAYLADLQFTTSNPAFQSPERILGGDLSPADDTWAVAATLYTALTGASPFAGASDADARPKILAAAPPPLATYDVGDDDLQHILDRAFARDIKARTATVAALRRALEEWHPDPDVGALLPLDDEEASDGADRISEENTRTQGPSPASYAVQRAVDHDDDDDDDDMRTRLREMPQLSPKSLGEAGPPQAAAPPKAAAAAPASAGRAPAPPGGAPAALGAWNAALAAQQRPSSDDDDDDEARTVAIERRGPDRAPPSSGHDVPAGGPVPGPWTPQRLALDKTLALSGEEPAARSFAGGGPSTPRGPAHGILGPPAQLPERRPYPAPNGAPVPRAAPLPGPLPQPLSGPLDLTAGNRARRALRPVNVALLAAVAALLVLTALAFLLLR